LGKLQPLDGDNIMALETIVEQKELASSVNRASAIVPLQKVMDAIRQDSSQDAEQYLDETIVPRGGE
jgi:hypothetical protein